MGVKRVLMTAGVVLALIAGGVEAYARPLASVGFARDGVSVRSSTLVDHVISDGDVRIGLPHGWDGVVVHGGVGASASGVSEFVIANFRLPSNASACEALIPRLGRHQVMVRVFDYGPTPIRAVRSGERLRLGALRPVHDWAMRSRAMAVSRASFHGRRLAVQSVFGANHPAASVTRRVRLLLGAVRG
jgi:hypothetical protein